MQTLLHPQPWRKSALSAQTGLLHVKFFIKIHSVTVSRIQRVRVLRAIILLRKNASDQHQC